MPVHEVSPGRWRWGKTGKTYSSKARAVAQARAIFASGYRDDGPPRRPVHRILSASKRAESRYVLDLLAILRGVHRGVMAVVMREVLGEPAYRQGGGAKGTQGYRADAPPPPLPPGTRAQRVARAVGPELRAKVLRHVQATAPPAFDRMADQVDQGSAAATASLIGLPAATLAEGIDGVIDTARAANIDLISSASDDFLDDIRDVLEDPDNEGLRVEELRDLLVERAGVSESRATLIARDQTTKLNASLNQHRQVAAGVERYTWSTSHDERVRESHAELDGQEFSWDDPPEVDGELAHPGDPVMCRCIAAPVLEPDDEDEEPDEG